MEPPAVPKIKWDLTSPPQDFKLPGPVICPPQLTGRVTLGTAWAMMVQSMEYAQGVREKMEGEEEEEEEAEEEGEEEEEAEEEEEEEEDEEEDDEEEETQEQEKGEKEDFLEPLEENIEPTGFVGSQPATFVLSLNSVFSSCVRLGCVRWAVRIFLRDPSPFGGGDAKIVSSRTLSVVRSGIG